MSEIVRTIAIVIAAFLSETASAQIVQEAPGRNLYSGNALYASCTGQAPDRIECQGFIQGVIDTESFFESTKALRPNVCYPASVQGQQLVEVVVNFLRDHPELRQNDSSSLVFQALRTAFPCK